LTFLILRLSLLVGLFDFHSGLALFKAGHFSGWKNCLLTFSRHFGEDFS